MGSARAWILYGLVANNTQMANITHALTNLQTSPVTYDLHRDVLYLNSFGSFSKGPDMARKVDDVVRPRQQRPPQVVYRCGAQDVDRPRVALLRQCKALLYLPLLGCEPQRVSASRLREDAEHAANAAAGGSLHAKGSASPE